MNVDQAIQAPSQEDWIRLTASGRNYSPLWRPSKATLPTEIPQPSPTSTHMAVTQLPPNEPLTIESSSDEIRQRVLGRIWDTLWLDGQATYINPDGSTETFFVQAWLERHGGGHIIGSDQLDNITGRPEHVTQGWSASSAGERGASSEPWSTHPLEMKGSVMELIFPRFLSARAAPPQAIGEDQVAGRAALVVRWGGDIFWIDKETGVLLKQQHYNKMDTTGPVTLEVSIDSIAFNVPMPTGGLDLSHPDQVQFEIISGAQPTPTPGK
jgi:hypothetical protein